MPFLYRTAVIVSRKQPHIDWANSLREAEDDKLPLELAQKRDIYLGPHSELQQTLAQALDEICVDIFEEELFVWSTNEVEWPSDRTRAMFDEWFETELAESIIDLVPEDPLTEEDMDRVDVEEAMHTCAWCGSELGTEQGRLMTFGLTARDRLDDPGGRVLALLVKRKRVVTGVLTPKDSTPAREGADVIFRACSRPCEKHLLQEVPGPLMDLEERVTASQQTGE